MTVTGDVEHLDIDAGDGLRLHATRSGSGPAVVLLHGFTGSAGSWDSLRARLSTRFTVVAVDMPGHGRSGAPADPSRYALPRFAEDLVRVLDSLALARAALLGYSMGGRAAMHAAAAHPERYPALVLESASAEMPDPAEREARLRSDAELADFIEHEGVEAFVDRWEQLPLWASQSSLPRPAREALRRQRLVNEARGLANSLRGAGAAADPVTAAQLATLTMPTLLVAGALDAKYCEAGRRLASTLPQAHLELIEGAGHAVHLEKPAEFGDAVMKFLSRRP